MAKTPARAPAEPAPRYVMPRVELGDVVRWHDEQEAEPTGMAVVTEVGTESVSLLVIPGGSFNGNPKSGVRHIDHPNKEIVRQTGQGVWSERPAALALEARLAAVEAILADLAGAPAPK